MIRAEHQRGALKAINAIFVRARAAAYEGDTEDMAEVFDVAEYLPCLMLETRDRTDEFRGQLVDLAERFPRYARALSAFDEPDPTEPPNVARPAQTSLDGALQAFVAVLRSGWLQVERTWSDRADLERGQLMSDWAQANWETIVEARLSTTRPVYLDVYGDGADCNPMGSRVSLPDAVPTHELRCHSIIPCPRIRSPGRAW